MRRTLVLSFPYASAMGGGERYLERLVEGFASRGRAFTLVSSSRALLDLFRARKWESVRFWAGIEPVTALTAFIFPLFAVIFFPIITLLLIWAKHRGADSVICLSMTDKLIATIPSRLLGLRVVWIEHLIPGRSIVLNPHRFALALLSRLAMVVTVSGAVEQNLIRIGFSTTRIRVIPPALSNDELVSAVAPDAPVVGVVSRLAHEKNLPLLLKAFALATKEVPEASLVIYGEGPERDALLHLSDRLGLASRIHWAGFSDDRRAIYGSMRVLAVPSSQESFGLSALEAMGRGVPVVATRVGGLPEVVADGETGILVPPDDALAFSQALVKMLKDGAFRDACAKASKERARLFSLERTLDAWDRILSETSSNG